MERVLVAYAGPTGVGEIALVVGEQLCRAGLAVDVRPVARAGAPEGYAAVVVGSAVRDGRWSADASGYLTRNAVALAERPLWLYERVATDAEARGSVPTGLEVRGADGPVRFGPDDLGPARSWGFGISCVMRPLALPATC
jgi:hypothetical protein